MNIEMTKDQATALKVWLTSATYENEYRAIGMDALAKLLKDEHEVQTSSSSLGRWRAKFGWSEILEAQIATALTKDEEIREVIEKSSLSEGSEKVFDDFRANEAIKNRSYVLVGKQLEYYEKQMIKHNSLSEKEVKVVVELLKITSDREDKLLDRQAMFSAAKLLNSKDVMAEITAQNIDLEEVIEVEDE